MLGRGLLYTVGTAAPVLSNALATPFVTRMIGPTEYGIVAVATVILQIGMILAGLGLAAAITRHGIIERSGVSGARYLVLCGALLSIPVALVALALYPVVESALDLGSVASYALALLASIGFASVVNTQSYLRVLDRPLPFVLLSISSALGGPLVGVVLLSTVDASAEAYLAGLAVGYLLSGAIGLVLTVRGGSREHHKGDLGRALHIGLPTIPHQVSIYLISGVLVLVASVLFSGSAAGRLQLAVLIGSAPGVLTSSLNNAWAPVVYRATESERAHILESTSRDIAWLAACAAGFVALLAPTLLAIVAPAGYDPTTLTPAVALAAAGTVFSVPYLANVHLVFASGRSRGLSVATPLALLVGATCAVLAGRILGLTAVAVGMTATYLGMVLGAAFLARRVSPTRWREGVLIAPTLAGVALCVLGGSLPAGDGTSLPRLAAGALLVVASLVQLRRVSRR